MSDPIDKALDQYLSGNSQISQRYRELDDAAVPPQLNQLVLAHARAAVAGQQQAHTDELERLRKRRKRLMRWSVPAGLAASAVLVISIVMQSGVQHEVSLPQQPVSVPAEIREPVDRSSNREREGLVVLTQPDVSAPLMAPPEVSDAPSGQVEQKIESIAKRLRQEQSAALPVTAAPNLANEPAFAPSVAAPAPPPPTTASLPASAALNASQDIQRSVSSRAIDHAASEEAVAKRQAAQARDDGLRATAEAAAARGKQVESLRAESQADHDLSEIIVTGNLARRAPGIGPRGTVRQSTSAESESDAVTAGAQIHEEPKHWLERIRQLRKDGKAQDADREWQRFREAYPDYTVAETDAARAKP